MKVACRVELFHSNVCYGVEQSWPKKAFNKPNFESLSSEQQQTILRKMERDAVKLHEKYVSEERLAKRRLRRTQRALAVPYEIRYRRNCYEYLKSLGDDPTEENDTTKPNKESDTTEPNKESDTTEPNRKSDWIYAMVENGNETLFGRSSTESCITVINTQDSQSNPQSQLVKDENGNEIDDCVLVSDADETTDDLFSIQNLTNSEPVSHLNISNDSNMAVEYNTPQFTDLAESNFSGICSGSKSPLTYDTAPFGEPVEQNDFSNLDSDFESQKLIGKTSTQQ